MSENVNEGDDEKMKESKDEIVSLSNTPSGILGFDEISKGGIPYGRTILVSGTSGSRKTVFVAQFFGKVVMKVE